KRLAGDCRGAVVLYQRFLTTTPPQVQVDATHIALSRCAQELASRPPVVVLAPPAPPPPAPRPRPPRWWHDPRGLSLAAAGAAGCLGPPTSVSHADAQCGTDGFCESDGHCSARDPGCPSRRRYLAAAGDRSNACVAPTCAANPVVALAAGGAHACLLRQDGHV